MAWDPVFAESGNAIAAKVERDGKYSLMVNGKLWNKEFDSLWDPIFSPDGDSVLVRALEGSRYVRRVVPLAEML